MRVWLITVGEPMTCDGADVRLLRTGIFAEWLSGQGHDVVWWSSTFDHIRKQHRFSKETHLHLNKHLKLVLLHGSGYARNISLARVLNHVQIARRFRQLAPQAQPMPDVILCSFPTIELSTAATQFGQVRGIPVVLDVRDLWPDIFMGLVPKWAAVPARKALAPLFRATRKAFRQAFGITGITPEFVDWGLRKAGRAGSELDRDFPLAYHERPLALAGISDAERRWDVLLKGEGQKPFLCCFFGTMGRQFDIGTLIDAADRCNNEGRNIVFVLCGDGEYLERYRQRARDIRNVVFPGWVGHADIWTLMHRAKVGLAPYSPSADFQDSISNKTIEYLSAGLPILTTITGVTGRLITTHDCGWVYRHGDSDQLCGHLKALQDAPERQRTMSSNARHLYREKFRAEDVYSEMAAYLETIVAASRN